jgi:hypothetical protein
MEKREILDWYYNRKKDKDFIDYIDGSEDADDALNYYCDILNKEFQLSEIIYNINLAKNNERTAGKMKDILHAYNWGTLACSSSAFQPAITCDILSDFKIGSSTVDCTFKVQRSEFNDGWRVYEMQIPLWVHQYISDGKMMYIARKFCKCNEVFSNSITNNPATSRRNC